VSLRIDDVPICINVRHAGAVPYASGLQLAIGGLQSFEDLIPQALKPADAVRMCAAREILLHRDTQFRFGALRHCFVISRRIARDLDQRRLRLAVIDDNRPHIDVVENAQRTRR